MLEEIRPDFVLALGRHSAMTEIAHYLLDKLLPSMSNAVERSTRRYHKMQKSIYSVRIHDQIKVRIALDMRREAQDERREQTLQALHEAWAG